MRIYKGASISMTIRLRILFAALALVVAFGCGSAAKRSVELRSEPSDSEVKTTDGEVLGTTPLKLNEDVLNRITQKGVFSVEINHPGYVQDRLILDAHGEDVHDVKMRKLDESYFSHSLMADFAKQANAMARDLLRIHGALVARKFAETEQLIIEFQKKFPNVAASYVMRANVEVLRGNKKDARAYLVRAQSLDPEDSNIQRMLTQIGGD
jgi:hypothetical protein